jgi:hypothetical protein
MVDEQLDALLEIHEYICTEMGDHEIDNRWDEGFATGLKEARNSVERVIHERYGADE